MSDSESLGGGLFEEPEDFLPKPPDDHFTSFRRLDGCKPQELRLKLVGKSPLWGHLLWNAGKLTANYLDTHHELITDKSILELGAGSGLPSLICAFNGAKNVLITDYPDPDLLQNLQYNVDAYPEIADKVKVAGYIWGQTVDELLEYNSGSKYDTMILSDLVFNHREHKALLKTCQLALKPDGKVLVVFTPHRPHLLDKDLEFFDTAKEFGFESEEVAREKWVPMFEEDEETVEVRSMVYAYIMKFAQ